MPMKGQFPTQFVLFRLANEEYAFDIGTIKEIQDLQQIAKVHRTPDYIEGVMNLRGKLVTVIDLRRRLGLVAKPPNASTKIVVVDAADAPVGFLVDEVTEVATILPETVEPPPAIVAQGIEAAYVLGIAKYGERLITIIDPIKILDLSVEGDAKGGGTNG